MRVCTRKCYLLLVAIIWLSLTLMPTTHAHTQSNLPDLGNAVSPLLSPSDELTLGRSVLNQLRTTIKISNDTIVNDYLEAIGYRIVATFSQPNANFHFFTVLDTHINAFALPGGFIGVNSGLILACESESELAGVLAHEIAHVKQRHIARMYEHMGRIKISTIAGLIASIVLVAHSPEAATGAMAATLAGGQQAMINFTREHEREADSIGIRALAKAGFDPMGMPSFFHKMYQETRFYGNWVPEYLLTHPLSSDRLMSAKTQAQDYPYKQVSDSLQFHLIKARLHVTTAKSPHEAIEYYKQALNKGNYRSRIGTLYGLALAYLQAGQPELAQAPVLDLLSYSPHEPAFILINAQIAMDLHHSEQAIMQLEKGLRIQPRNYVLATTLAHWLLTLNQTADAINVLKKQMYYSPNKTELYMMLANAYTQAKQPAQAHLAQAQALKQQGDFQSALRQLNIANQLHTISDREKRQIEAQISEIQQKS